MPRIRRCLLQLVFLKLAQRNLQVNLDKQFHPSGDSNPHANVRPDVAVKGEGEGRGQRERLRGGVREVDEKGRGKWGRSKRGGGTR